MLDIGVALIALVIAAPLMLLVAVAIMLTMGSPVIFEQLRPGKDGKPFRMYKLRTMRHEFDANGQPLPDHLRLTRLGTFLRSYSLDELPELFNVLRGEMSLVGPRPLLLEYLPLYTARQARRHQVRPGITGWAQINGRNALTWTERFELDVWYVDNRSFWLDVRIILLTVARVLGREGISHAGEATMSRFTGNGHV